MSKNTIYCLLAALCLYVSTAARDKPRQHYIGDRLPMLELRPFKGSVPIQLGATASGPMLIDFFGTYCGPCVASLAKMDSLANLFGDQLTIVVVTHEKPEKLQAFLAKHPELSQSRLRWVVADTILHQYFPHTMIPHEVWLDAGGRVKAITSHEEVSESALQMLVMGAPLQLPAKADIMEYHRSRNLFSYSTEWANQAIRFGSYFTVALPGAPGSSGFYENDGFRKLYLVNSRLHRFFELAYQLRPDYVLETAPGMDAAIFPKESMYCYEQLKPLTSSRDMMLQGLRDDLAAFTGFTAIARKAAPGSDYSIPDTLCIQPIPDFFTSKTK